MYGISQSVENVLEYVNNQSSTCFIENVLTNSFLFRFSQLGVGLSINRKTRSNEKKKKNELDWKYQYPNWHKTKPIQANLPVMPSYGGHRGITEYEFIVGESNEIFGGKMRLFVAFDMYTFLFSNKSTT